MKTELYVPGLVFPNGQINCITIIRGNSKVNIVIEKINYIVTKSEDRIFFTFPLDNISIFIVSVLTCRQDFMLQL